MGQPPVLTSSTQKLNLAANSARWGDAHVVSKVLDAISELGSDADFVAFAKKIGAEVLVERTVLQHVVGGGQQRGRNCDGSLFGSASSFKAKELCLIVGALAACCAPSTLDQDGLQPRCTLPDARRSALAGALVEPGHEPRPGQ